MYVLLQSVLVLSLLLSSDATHNGTAKGSLRGSIAKGAFKGQKDGVAGRWIRNRGYEIIFQKEPWFDAQVYCKEIGKQLASFRSSSDLNQFIKVYENSVPPGPPQSLESRAGVWLAGNRLYTSEYVWDSTPPTPMNFTYWKRGEPSKNGNEQCVETHPLEDFYWNDAPCQDPHEFACEHIR